MNSRKIIDFEQAKQNIPRKKSLPEITIMRSLAMLAVVCIHFLNIPVSNIQTGTMGQGFFFTWRSMLVFAVPSFIFMSMLTVAYTANEKLPLLDFYKKKLLRVAIPYIVWSIGYLLILVIVGHYTIGEILNPKSIFYFLAYGKSYEHLYFMPILLEFFFITPLLLPIARKVKNSPKAAIGIAFGVQIIIYFLNKNIFYPHFKMLSSTFLWYFSIGFLGLWFGCNYHKNFELVKKHSAKIFVLLAGVGIIHRYYSKLLWQQLWNVVSFNTFLHTVNLHLYMLLCTLFLLLIANWFCEYPRNAKGQEKKSYRFLLWASPLSYGIYLMHPVFMYLLRKIFELPPLQIRLPMLWIPIILLGVPSIAWLCGKITAFFQYIPIISLAFGNSAFLKKNRKAV